MRFFLNYFCFSSSLIVLQIFGPIQCFLKFKDLDDVIQRANNTHFGLAAGIYIKNADSALEIAKYLESGTVWLVSKLNK